MQSATMAAILCVVMAAGAVAQAPPLVPGQRVRVTAAAAELDKQVGTFQALEGDVLVFVAETPARVDHRVKVRTITRVPVTAVERLDVRTGSRDNALLGGLVGFFVGGACGALVAYTGFTESESPGRDLLIPIGGVVFAAIGLIGGYFVKTDTWTQVPAERLKMGVGSAGGRVAVMASVPF
jgi:hypothetical protein